MHESFYGYDSTFCELSDLIIYAQCQLRLMEGIDLPPDETLELHLYDLAYTEYVFASSYQDQINEAFEKSNSSWRVVGISERLSPNAPSQDIPVGLEEGQRDNTGAYVTSSTAVTGVLCFQQPGKRYAVWTIKEVGLKELVTGNCI